MKILDTQGKLDIIDTADYITVGLNFPIAILDLPLSKAYQASIDLISKSIENYSGKNIKFDITVDYYDSYGDDMEDIGELVKATMVKSILSGTVKDQPTIPFPREAITNNINLFLRDIIVLTNSSSIINGFTYFVTTKDGKIINSLFSDEENKE